MSSFQGLGMAGGGEWVWLYRDNLREIFVVMA